ncbi:alpha-E domain-containing protein [Mangrovibacterium lignilyticum]|uniref:alpha-E domain-containing protein n=1 Tax=Mangrovibacterium lignilyticum TaxID=2668052 RepID=UPI0013D34601|nr:alpha-E domain-containing protein [Mangrovibacterium lignilyticum]
MLSRVADAMYWMNRYMERAENYARFMDVSFNLSLELPPDVSEQWQPLVVTTGDWELYQVMNKTISKQKVIYFLGFDPKNPNSIYNCIINARENARSIRPEITKELWAQINYLYYFVKDGLAKKIWTKRDPRMYFDEIKKGCQLFWGIIDATISRTEGWHFGRIGKLLERADKTSRILDVKYHILLPSPQDIGSALDIIQWAALLKSVSAYDMYRKLFGKLTPSGIANFLILDKEFPRSMLLCLEHTALSLKMISGKNSGYSNLAEKEVGILTSQLEYADINDIIKTGMHEYLDNFQIKLNNVSSAIADSFFSIENSITKM